MFKKILLLALLWASPALAQNVTCPTRPLGDNSNACADTAFVQAALPSITVTAQPFGADPTGTNDSTAAIQAAISALPVRGGDVLFPCGTYKISSLTIGNGSSSAQSTRSGVRLLGVGVTIGPYFGSTETPCVTLLYNGSAGGTMLSILGPLQGWGLENLNFNCANTAGVGLQIVSGAFGNSRNLSFQNCNLVGLQSTTVSTIPAGLSNADSLHNTFVNTAVTVPNTLGANGISLTGQGTTSNTDYALFFNTHVQLPSSGTNQTLTAVYEGFADSNQFYGLHIFQGLSSNVILQFDYTVTAGFPTNNFFFGVDPSGSAAPPIRYQNIGSPSGIVPQYIYGLITANGAGYPAIAGLCAQGPTQIQVCGATSGNGSISATATGGTLQFNGGPLATASGGTGDIGTAWTTFTATPTCGTATITTNSARSKTLGKTTWIEGDFKITAIGTGCTGILTFSLPVNSNSSMLLSGQEVFATGVLLGCGTQGAGSVASCEKQGGAVYAATDRLIFSGVYENQ